MWAYNKNYCRIYKNDEESDLNSRESSDDSSNEEEEARAAKKIEDRYKTYTYDFLIKLILKHAPESATEKIKSIAKWNL